MIAKHVQRVPENDCYRALAIYCQGGHASENEKVLDKWYAGGLTDDYGLGLIEVEATQALNKTSSKEKTYHLVLSFRPEDESKLTPELFRDIEREFANALGYQAHQRHVGVHQNTNNMHMHVAYNMIQPETFVRRELKGDYYVLSRACRELEQRYGLVVDPGMEQADTQKISAKAQSVEIKTGQQSFQSYAKERKEFILEAVEAAVEAKNWQVLHEALAKRGILLKHISGGLSFVNAHGKGGIKASGVDRSLSRGSLEKRLGTFEAAQVRPEYLQEKLQVVESYQAKPLQKGLERAERAALYAEFKAGLDKRIEALKELQDKELAAREQELLRWQTQGKAIESNAALLPRDKTRLRTLARVREQESRKKLETDFSGQRQVVKEEFPFCNWNQFLQAKARQGDETALAVLRSQNKEVEPEREAANPAQHQQRCEVRDKWRQTQAEIRLNEKLNAKDKRSLISVAKMRQLDELAALSTKKANPFAGFTYNIDAQGVVMFRLANGGAIRDAGQEIYFSQNDPSTKEAMREAAQNFAQAKWGKNVKLEGNKLVADFTPTLEAEKTLGLERKQEPEKQQKPGKRTGQGFVV